MKNCIFCKGGVENKIVEHKEFGVLVGKFPAKVCVKCGEVFYDAETVDKIQAESRKKGLFGLAKKTKVAEVGNSLAVRIPKSIAKFVNLKKNTEVTIMPHGRHGLSINQDPQ